MKCFHAQTDEGFEATIFADREKEAVTMFCTHHETVMGRMPGAFTIERRAPPTAILKRDHWEHALARGIKGIGYYMSGKGWSVIPDDLVVILLPQPVR